MHDQPPVLPLSIVVSLWLVCAAICVLWPKKVQALAIRSSSKWPAWYLKYYPFAGWSKEWMQTSGFVLYLRAMGISMIILTVFLVAVLFKPR
jgi:hypothetical protein